ncbi:hypothetical protein ScPMuIL_004684 [Solemya velum]
MEDVNYGEQEDKKNTNVEDTPFVTNGLTSIIRTPGSQRIDSCSLVTAGMAATVDIVTIILLNTFICAVLGSTPRITPPSHYSVREDTAINTKLFTLTAIDGDNDHIAIAYVHGNQVPPLVRFVQTVNDPGRASADVFLNDKLDTDGQSSQRFIFFTLNDGHTSREHQITLDLIDVNDISPEFHGEPYRAKVQEDASIGSLVYSQISTTDLDTGYGGQVNYSMEPTSQSVAMQNAAKKTFQINSSSGVITLTGTLDYETTPFYQFNITATDKGSPPLSSSAILVIEVMDVQDSPPFFQGLPYMPTIPEGVPLGYSVLTVRAQDGDLGVPNQIKFTLEPDDDNCSRLFNIDATTGVITVSGVLDRDAGPVYTANGVCSVDVTAFEVNNGTPQPRNTSTSTPMTITVLDGNDNAPVFSESHYSGTVEENSALGIPITTHDPIHVSDLDQGKNAEMSITLLNPDGSENTYFEPLPSTVLSGGNILIRVVNNSLLDYEARQAIQFVIVAREKYTKENHSSNVTVTVNITNMNDNTPVFTDSSYTFSIPENSDNGTAVGQIQATDDDLGDFGILTYRLLRGDGKFTINDKTGEVITSARNEELDRERKSLYYMMCGVTDGGGRRTTTGVTVTLTDVNDNAPVFSEPSYQTTVRENTGRFNPPVIVKSTDTDVGNNSVIRYRLEDFSDKMSFTKNFSINTTSGEITLTGPLDYESLGISFGGDIQLAVVAYDLGDPPQESNVTFTVNFQDANDLHPRFNMTNYNASIYENSTAGQHVVTVSAEDKDGTSPNNEVFFQVGSDRFNVNTSTGEITVSQTATFDHDITDSYDLVVVVRDGGQPQNSASATVHIAILDVNNKPPSFDVSGYTASVSEHTAQGTVIQNCTASDTDEDSLLQYSLKVTKAFDEFRGEVNLTTSLPMKSWFSIDNMTGAVWVNGELDREAAEQVILVVGVKDLHAAKGGQTATAELVVYLEDYNDNAPVFDNATMENGVYDAKIMENARNDTVITTVKAVDRDKRQTVTYSIIDGDSKFHVNPQSGPPTSPAHYDPGTHSQSTNNKRDTANNLTSPVL